MTTHPDKLMGFDNARHAAREIARLRYDALAELLKELSDELERCSEEDELRGRGRLASMLCNISVYLEDAASATEDAWAHCKAHMGSK